MSSLASENTLDAVMERVEPMRCQATERLRRSVARLTLRGRGHRGFFVLGVRIEDAFAQGVLRRRINDWPQEREVRGARR